MLFSYNSPRSSRLRSSRPVAQRSSASQIKVKLAFGQNLDFLKNNVVWQVAGFVILTVTFFYLVQTINSNSSIQSQAASSDSARIITNFNLQSNLKTQSKVEIAEVK